MTPRLVHRNGEVYSVGSVEEDGAEYRTSLPLEDAPGHPRPSDYYWARDLHVEGAGPLRPARWRAALRAETSIRVPREAVDMVVG